MEYDMAYPTAWILHLEIRGTNNQKMAWGREENSTDELVLETAQEIITIVHKCAHSYAQ